VLNAIPSTRRGLADGVCVDQELDHHRGVVAGATAIVARLARGVDGAQLERVDDVERVRHRDDVRHDRALLAEALRAVVLTGSVFLSAGFTATFGATHSRAIATPPLSGGLFLGQDIANLGTGAFVIDHDQALSLQTTGHYTRGRNWWVAGAVRYDSGLVAGAADPKAVALSRDYRDLLPYVDLTSSTPRVLPRTVVNLTMGYQPGRGGDRRARTLPQHGRHLDESVRPAAVPQEGDGELVDRPVQDGRCRHPAEYAPYQSASIYARRGLWEGEAPSEPAESSGSAGASLSQNLPWPGLMETLSGNQESLGKSSTGLTSPWAEMKLWNDKGLV